MQERRRREIADVLERTRLLGPAERIRGYWHTAREGRGSTWAADGLPVPPARLRLLVDGRDDDGSAFITAGREMAGAIGAAAVGSGRALEEMGAILDFGGGCGRVARHWAGLDGPEIHLSDYNPDMVAWVGANLPFVHAGLNRLAPPTAYVAGSFDMVYALSVFTHLTEPLQDAWVAELRRILRPGGLLMFTVLGDAFRGRMSDGERRRYDRGEMVIERPRMAGRNSCTVYHPPSYVEGRLLDGFEGVRPVAFGRPEFPLAQDAYVARRFG
jgi:SAM-dependent methyltransferase